MSTTAGMFPPSSAEEPRSVLYLKNYINMNDMKQNFELQY